MKLRAETNFLLRKQSKQALGPVEVIGGAVISTLAFILTFWSMSCLIRVSSPAVATLIVGALAIMAMLANYIGVARYRMQRTARTWLVLALCLWAGLVVGLVLGNNYWWLGVGKYQEYHQMASYVNVDPSRDKGSSFMDAGAIYFKDRVSVDRTKAIAFRNGLTYCIAPVILDPLEAASAGNASDSRKTAAGFLIPTSGTLDFWAVGTNCCGTTGTPFSCFDAANPFARSGLRVLDDTHIAMYQLAVQEWTATTGVPAKYPLFFEWSLDPLMLEDKLKSMASNSMLKLGFVYALAALLVSYVLHMLFRYYKVL
mmetsp:Transcript_44895/g.97692  ORF Transcript_44895/g.97692 Transcript_44895/m.97692 type:complete len:313 (+) Transcript_44895:74-1012(+)